VTTASGGGRGDCFDASAGPVGDPRTCWSKTAAGSPSAQSDSGIPGKSSRNQYTGRNAIVSIGA
jgi:hypothetical protein